MRSFAIDLHIHTALSPCADLEMSPLAICRRAREQGLDLIAICDHNAGGNVQACIAAGEATGLSVLAGMEVQTREEAHVICVFPSADALLTWQATVWQHLPAAANRPEYFGYQVLFAADDRIVGQEQRLLLTSTDLPVEAVFAEVATHGGLCWPAHIDRPSYSLLGNLGFLPPALGCKAAEISRLATPADVRTRFPDCAELTLLSASDAHWLSDIQPARTRLIAAAPTFDELALALVGHRNRRVVMDAGDSGP